MPSCRPQQHFQQHGIDIIIFIPSLSSRPYGECSSPLQRSPKADPSSAHWPAVSCSPLSSPCCLPSNAATDPVPQPAGTAYSHDALPRQAEPHYPHSETLWPGPSGDTTGKGIQVLQQYSFLHLKKFFGLMIRINQTSAFETCLPNAVYQCYLKWKIYD